MPATLMCRVDILAWICYIYDEVSRSASGPEGRPIANFSAQVPWPGRTHIIFADRYRERGEQDEVSFR